MLGQVSLTNAEFKDLQIRTTVVPFIAIGVAAGIGYLYFKPKIDLVMRILDILQRVFPFLQSSSSAQVSGFGRYPFMRRLPPSVKVITMKRMAPSPVAKNANDIAVDDGGKGQFSWWVPDGGVPPIGEVFIPDGDYDYLPTIKRQSGFYKYIVANTIIDELG